LDFDLGHLFDSSYDIFILSGDQSDAGTGFASSSSSSRSVDVRVDVVRRRKLDDKIDQRNVEPSGSHVGGNHALDLSFSE
jgi:hypothetical protein